MSEEKTEKKSILKKWWFWAIIVVLAVAVVNAGNNNTVEEPTGSKPQVTQNQTGDNESAQEVKEEENIPTEYKSALKKAKSYSDTMHMSKKGIYDQLVSEYGEKFTPEAAQYAIDNIEADWKENALKKAQSYQSTMSMSPSAIRDQLISEYGEKFTEEEADYAISNLK